MAKTIIAYLAISFIAVVWVFNIAFAQTDSDSPTAEELSNDPMRTNDADDNDNQTAQRVEMMDNDMDMDDDMDMQSTTSVNTTTTVTAPAVLPNTWASL